MEKARITNIDSGQAGNNDFIECLFNPGEYSSTKENTWTAHNQIGGDLPRLEFGGGSSQTLTMQLFLDTTSSGKDVRDVIQKFLDLMTVHADLTDSASGKGRPPRVEFSWGKKFTFKAVITRLSHRCILFSEEGVPLRATLDVDFKQAEESQMQPQNPTTPGKAGYKKYIVEDGDTIDWIAFNEYKDASQWRFLADANNLDNPGKIKPGQVLSIPPLV